MIGINNATYQQHTNIGMHTQKMILRIDIKACTGTDFMHFHVKQTINYL